MIEQLESLLDYQRARLQQLNKVSRMNRDADILAQAIQELCDGLEVSIGCAVFLEKHKALEIELYELATNGKPSEKQAVTQNNPVGFELEPSPRPEGQGTLPLEPSRPIPPAPQYQGSMRDRYDIYVSCVEGTGQPVKTFDEWMNS